MELVAILPLTQSSDRLESFLKGLPLGQVQLWARVVAFGTDALKTCPIFAVVEGGVDKYLRLGAVCVGAGDHQVPLVEMPVAE